jgi:mono/diheme cytochrome c family protein
LKRGGRVVVGAVGLAAATLLAAGCGYGGVASASSHPDTQNGQKLFSASCGSCHTLQAAGTSGTIGPNLDNAFATDRSEGYADISIENVVLDQIRLGSGPIATYTTAEHGVKGLTPQTQMPSNIVTGQNAIDVAAYVASVAGVGGVTMHAVALSSLGNDGKAIVKAACGSCHTLAAAGISGTIGPNLDQLASKLTTAIIVHQVTNGGAIMPPFQGKLTTAQIQAVANYVASVAGKK